MGAAGAGEVGAAVAAVKVEADTGASQEAPYSACVSGNAKLLSVDLSTGFAGASPVSAVATSDAESDSRWFGGGFWGQRS